MPPRQPIDHIALQRMLENRFSINEYNVARGLSSASINGLDDPQLRAAMIDAVTRNNASQAAFKQTVGSTASGFQAAGDASGAARLQSMLNEVFQPLTQISEVLQNTMQRFNTAPERLTKTFDTLADVNKRYYAEVERNMRILSRQTGLTEESLIARSEEIATIAKLKTLLSEGRFDEVATMRRDRGTRLLMDRDAEFAGSPDQKAFQRWADQQALSQRQALKEIVTPLTQTASTMAERVLFAGGDPLARIAWNSIERGLDVGMRTGTATTNMLQNVTGGMLGGSMLGGRGGAAGGGAGGGAGRGIGGLVGGARAAARSPMLRTMAGLAAAVDAVAVGIDTFGEQKDAGATDLEAVGAAVGKGALKAALVGAGTLGGGALGSLLGPVGTIAGGAAGNWVGNRLYDFVDNSFMGGGGAGSTEQTVDSFKGVIVTAGIAAAALSRSTASLMQTSTAVSSLGSATLNTFAGMLTGAAAGGLGAAMNMYGEITQQGVEFSSNFYQQAGLLSSGMYRSLGVSNVGQYARALQASPLTALGFSPLEVGQALITSQRSLAPGTESMGFVNDTGTIARTLGVVLEEAVSGSAAFTRLGGAGGPMGYLSAVAGLGGGRGGEVNALSKAMADAQIQAAEQLAISTPAGGDINNLLRGMSLIREVFQEGDSEILRRTSSISAQPMLQTFQALDSFMKGGASGQNPYATGLLLRSGMSLWEMGAGLGGGPGGDDNARRILTQMFSENQMGRFIQGGGFTMEGLNTIASMTNAAQSMGLNVDQETMRTLMMAVATGQLDQIDVGAALSQTATGGGPSRDVGFEGMLAQRYDSETKMVELVNDSLPIITEFNRMMASLTITTTEYINDALIPSIMKWLNLNNMALGGENLTGEEFTDMSREAAISALQDKGVDPALAGTLFDVAASTSASGSGSASPMAALWFSLTHPSTWFGDGGGGSGASGSGGRPSGVGDLTGQFAPSLSSVVNEQNPLVNIQGDLSMTEGTLIYVPYSDPNSVVKFRLANDSAASPIEPTLP